MAEGDADEICCCNKLLSCRCFPPPSPPAVADADEEESSEGALAFEEEPSLSATTGIEDWSP
ncbi:hypothetical protein NL529_28610, partial [Klebsiella pneumoniae]|nr:hypothetical protein [Klebsiella pneumoniae]